MGKRRNPIPITINKSDSLKASIIEAGYLYAKDCFNSEEQDPDALRLPDSRLDPNFLSIYDAPGHILGYSLEDIIQLDPNVFTDKLDSKGMGELMTSLLDDDSEYYFIEGERKYINEIYGEDW